MPQVNEQIQEIFRDVFDDSSIVLADDMTAADVDGWDSLAHINLIIALEKKLRIKFASAEISRMKEPGQNVGTLCHVVAGKMQKAA